MFCITKISIMMHFHYPQTLFYVLVTRVFFQQTMNDVQRQSYEVAIKVKKEFEKMFLAQELMDTLKVVYSQYWLKCSCEETF